MLIRGAAMWLAAVLFGGTACVFAHAEAPRPNIVLILVDDMGYSDPGCFGGEIRTPNIDRLGTNGLRFTQFYNTARCSPTRASLLTGLYSWQAGIGRLVEDWLPPGYTPALNRRCVTLGEVLRTAGYRTLMSGKWHIGGSETNQLPPYRGFDRWFGVAPASTGSLPSGGGYYGADYWLDTTFTHFTNVEYSTDRFTDFALQFIEESVTLTHAPFFLHLAYTAPHFPLTAPAEDIARYRGTYTNDWAWYRQQRFARQRAMGIVSTNWTLSTPDHTQVWTNLTAAQKDTQDEMMSKHAAMVDRIDQNIGRLVSALQGLNQFSNTVIFFLSDNGCSAEGGALGSTNQIGQTWANVADTPLRLYKKFVREGGVATPLIAHWPAGIPQPGLRTQPGHVIDLMPTCVELAGATYPASFHGNPIRPFEGRSLVRAFTNATVEPRVLFFEHEGHRAVRSNDWKLVSIGRGGPWELYHLAADRTETTNLAAADPARVRALWELWEAMAHRVDDYPSPDNSTSLQPRSWVAADDRAGGDGDGQPEPGETLDLSIRLLKQGTGSNTGLTGTLTALGTNVTVLASNAAYGSFSGGTASNPSPFRVRVAARAPVNQTLLFDMTVRAGSAVQWSDVVGAVVRSFADVTGLVTEAGTGERLGGATVAGGMIAAAETDRFGRYRMLLEPGDYTMAASLDGFTPTQRAATIVGPLAADFALGWAATGLTVRLDRPRQAVVTVPPDVSLLLRATVHEQPPGGTGAPARAWSAPVGPAPVAFESPAVEDTAVRFAAPGRYSLRLTAARGTQAATQTVTVLVSSNPAALEVTNGLAAWWRLDDPAGSATAADSAGTNAGALLNMNAAAAWTGGVRGGALAFDGSNDVVRLPDAPETNQSTTRTRTVSAWFRAEDPSGSTKQVIYEEGGTTRGLNFYLASGRLYAGGWNTDTSQSSWAGTWFSTTNVAAGRWHHAALALDGGPTVTPNALTAYLDGAEIGRGPGSMLWPRGSDNGLGARLDATRFHDGGQSGTGNYFRGWVDDVRIFARALDATEVAALATTGGFSRVVRVDAGPDQDLHAGLEVPLQPRAEPLGPQPPDFLASWRLLQGPAGATAAFADPGTNGIPARAILDPPGRFTLRLEADNGDVATVDDVAIGAMRSFDEWIAGYAGLTPAQRLPGADPDLDGADNGMEYEMGTPPDCAGCVPGDLRLRLERLAPSGLAVSAGLRRGALDRGLAVEVHRIDVPAANGWTSCPATVDGFDDTTDFEWPRLRLRLEAAAAAEPVQSFRMRFLSSAP